MTATADAHLVYKIARAGEWEQAVAAGLYAGSPDDARDGFIHLSSGDQLAETAAKYFAGIEGLVLIALAPADLGARLVWEPSRGGALFPHYYGALPIAAARWVRPLPLDADGRPSTAAIVHSEAFP